MQIAALVALESLSRRQLTEAVARCESSAACRLVGAEASSWTEAAETFRVERNRRYS